MSDDDINAILTTGRQEMESIMRSLMDDLGMNMKMLKNSSIFSGEEDRFAFARTLSRRP